MFRMSSKWIGGLGPIALVLLTACSHDAKPPAPPPQPAPPPPPVQTAKPATSMVNVSQDILTECKISDAGTEAVGPSGAPVFAFDSATLSSGDQHVLVEVAQCMTKGPLTGKALKLTGHTDPRGTEEYNLALGNRRASSVMRFLERQGMASGKLNETSRGSQDASGSDEAGWQKDRRVDVDLAM